jgi:dihydrofolate reductase
MRKIILSLAASLDNYIEGPNGEVDWMTFNAETGIALNNFIQEIDTILYGRISYERYGNYTPPENSSDFEKDFYAKTNKMNKYVFSSSRTDFGASLTVVNSEIKKSMMHLKQQSGKNIWLYGGAQLITTFMNLNLVDEIRIAVMPIILGSGKPLFSGLTERTALKLTKVESSQLGVVGLYYERPG